MPDRFNPDTVIAPSRSRRVPMRQDDWPDHGVAPSGRPLVGVPILADPDDPDMTDPSDEPEAEAPGRYPIQLAKVKRPVLRAETLERPRLLDWLRLKVHGRVVLLLADAGYGKTTLLADFSRRTRLRTLWFRLDDDDRDWVSFLRHLVAAGREHDPAFAPATAAMLDQIGLAGPSREAVLDCFLRELPSIAEGGAALILDDFHVVDDAVDPRHIVRELLARGPERLSIVFASRRTPTVPLARLRTAGEVAELSTDDLRFDLAETSRLFTETYGRRMDADVLIDLTRRTEGWIASLQLVQAALRDRSAPEIRRFVRSLTGADHDLYDYLAEEVVGDLPAELQRFLMDTSVLQVVTPVLAAVVSQREPDDVLRLTAAAERLTLLSRLAGGPRTHQRYHPLVREFLEARFRSLDGRPAVQAVHRRAASAAARSDWRVAAHHYREAGDIEAMLEVVGESIPTIMGNGQYALAENFMTSIPADLRPSGFDLILSRVSMQHGDFETAISASQSVLDLPDLDPVQRDHALLNLLTLHLNNGDGDRAIEFARLLLQSVEPGLRDIARGSLSIVEAGTDGSLDASIRLLQGMTRRQGDDRTHHLGVTRFNLAWCLAAQDRNQEALRQVDQSIEAFTTSSAAIELSASRSLRASLLARSAMVEEVDSLIHDLMMPSHIFVADEVFIELGAAQDSFGSGDRATSIFARVGPWKSLSAVEQRLFATSNCRWYLRTGSHQQAADSLAMFPSGRATTPGITSELLAMRAYLAVARADPDAFDLAAQAERFARDQGAHSWRRVSGLLLAMTLGQKRLDSAVLEAGEEAPWHLTYVAELLVRRMPLMSTQARDVLALAAKAHPVRWRDAIRAHLASPLTVDVLEPARLLESVGEKTDIGPLRVLARSLKRSRDGSDLGRTLARRLADRIWFEDQGRTILHVGVRQVAGSTIRRKVLALACYLLTRSDLSATRDQVLDNIWPDLDPSLALNSLNQTLYFLRREFEEAYSEDLSPGYVRHDSDVIWFDPELVDSRSIRSRQLIRSMPASPSPAEVELLVATYRGRFALDFEYEEWAASYRDPLHASYLEIVERSVREDLETGHYARGISVARRALDVDPGAEQIEVSLLRLYRVTGAHSAAAEQYAHYAAVMREELGLEPPPLDTL